MVIQKAPTTSHINIPTDVGFSETIPFNQPVTQVTPVAGTGSIPYTPYRPGIVPYSPATIETQVREIPQVQASRPVLSNPVAQSALSFSTQQALPLSFGVIGGEEGIGIPREVPPFIQALSPNDFFTIGSGRGTLIQQRLLPQEEIPVTKPAPYSVGRNPTFKAQFEPEVAIGSLGFIQGQGRVSFQQQIRNQILAQPQIQTQEQVQPQIETQSQIQQQLQSSLQLSQQQTQQELSTAFDFGRVTRPMEKERFGQPQFPKRRRERFLYRPMTIKQPKKYSPSALAVLFGITSQRQRATSGFEPIRPIIVSSQETPRRRKVYSQPKMSWGIEMGSPKDIMSDIGRMERPSFGEHPFPRARRYKSLRSRKKKGNIRNQFGFEI